MKLTGLKFILLVFMIHVFFACNKNETNSDNIIDTQQEPTTKPTPPPTPAPTTPEPTPAPGNGSDEIDPLYYRWYYKGNVTENSVSSKAEICPEDFEVDGLCKKPLSFCQRKISLYACYPEDLQIRITGKVVDENNNPIPGVKIIGSYGYIIYDEMATKTKADGSFLLKNSNSCFPLVHALKDGYLNMDGFYQAIQLSKCKADNFIGASGLVIQLKKTSRSVPDAISTISTESSCRIAGKVLTVNGQGLAGVKVRNGNGSAVTNNEGIYIIEKDQKCDNFCSLYKEGYVAYFPSHESSAIVSCFEARPADVILTKK